MISGCPITITYGHFVNTCPWVGRGQEVVKRCSSFADDLKVVFPPTQSWTVKLNGGQQSHAKLQYIRSVVLIHVSVLQSLCIVASGLWRKMQPVRSPVISLANAHSTKVVGQVVRLNKGFTTQFTCVGLGTTMNALMCRTTTRVAKAPAGGHHQVKWLGSIG
jgi:hypothetical protein